MIYFILITSSGNFVTTTVDKTIDNSVAESAGIQSGDEILAINGEKIKLKTDLDYVVAKGEPLVLQVKRNNSLLGINIIPQLNEETNMYYLGIVFKADENNINNKLYYGFWETERFTASILDSLKLIFTGNISLQQFTGPVGISKVVSQTENIKQYVYMLAIISLSLGVTNLLPVPPLDGGKVLLLLIEGIIRKPIKETINNAIQVAGFILIMILAVIVTYNDVLKII